MREGHTPVKGTAPVKGTGRVGAGSVDAMGWYWRLADAAGTEQHPEGFGAQERFPSQSDAESWVGECWRELLDVGVTQVFLLEDGRQVYGPMSLLPAD